MKKKLINLQIVKTVFFGILISTIAIACNSDDEDAPTPEMPTISISGDNTIVAKAGEVFSVDLTLNAPGGNKELVVFTNGGLLETIALNSTATSFTYNTQVVPADASEGQEYIYQFALADTADQESGRVDFTINAAIYDEITIGSETLFNVTIPQDGIVATGISIKFIVGRNYYITEPLSFDDGSSLTIEEGVTVYMKKPTDVSENPIEISLNAGVDVSIIGTATNPVVMTSSATLTDDSESGDWDRFVMEEITNGTVKYLRTEYATIGFRVRSCDDSNTIEYISVFKSSEEGIYITNGNVNTKYLAAIETGDSNFRLGSEYSGNLQFLIAYNAGGGEEAFFIRDDSNITLANITAVGPGKDTDEVPDEFENGGIRFRSTIGGKVYNAVVTEMPDWGVRTDGLVPTDIDGVLVFAYSNVYENDSRDDNEAVIFFDEDSFNNSEDEIAGIDAGSIVPTTEEVSTFDPSTLGSFFSAALFKGAIQDSSNDWTTGWVKNPDGTIR